MPFTPAQALTRYRGRVLDANVKIEWFTRRVERSINIGLDRRARLAAQLLRDKIVVNISLPIERDDRGDVAVRSVNREFPRIETGRLMRDIFVKRMGPGWYRIGTTLDYGLILETRMNRSFILRTFREMRGQIHRMLITRQPGDPAVFTMDGI